MDLIKVENFALCKTMWRRWKTGYMLGKIFANHVPDKTLVFKIYKELSKLNSKK